MKEDVLPVLQRIKFERGLDEFQLFSIEFLINNFTTIIDFHETLREKGYREQPYKIASLDIVLYYIEIALEDGIITEDEKRQVKLMKRVFDVTEGDFYRFRFHRLKFLSELFLARLYLDNKITESESLDKVALQDFFDLSYDQFLELTHNFDRKALLKDVDVVQLDTFMTYNEFWKIKSEEFIDPMNEEYTAAYLYSIDEKH